MPDIDALFLKMMKERKPMYVASKLGYESTKVVERWQKNESVPAARKWVVFDLLKQEGYL